MDRPISKTEKKRLQWTNWSKVLLGIGVVSLSFWGLRSFLTTKIKEGDFRLATVELGDLENTITASGLVVPAFEQQVNAPIDTEIKEVKTQSGTKLKVGDLIMQLDETDILLQYQSLKDELEIKKNKITRLRLEFDKNLKELEYEDQIKALEVENLEASLGDMKRLRKVGGATEEEVEKASLNLKIARLQKNKLENDLDFRKKVLESDKRALELDVMVQEKKLLELERKLKQTTVTAPRAGVLTWVNESIGKEVKSGEALAKIADLASYRIEASCSDRYSSLVKVGMSVRVRINKQNLSGIIASILPAVENNTVAFIITLGEETTDLLRPNMRVEVFIISDKKMNAIRVKNGPGFNGAMEQEVFVVNGKEAVKKQVKIGMIGMDYIEIKEGLQQGERIIISDMTDYKHLDKIQLND